MAPRGTKPKNNNPNTFTSYFHGKNCMWVFLRIIHYRLFFFEYITTFGFIPMLIFSVSSVHKHICHDNNLMFSERFWQKSAGRFHESMENVVIQRAENHLLPSLTFSLSHDAKVQLIPGRCAHICSADAAVFRYSLTDAGESRVCVFLCVWAWTQSIPAAPSCQGGGCYRRARPRVPQEAEGEILAFRECSPVGGMSA